MTTLVALGATLVSFAALPLAAQTRVAEGRLTLPSATEAGRPRPLAGRWVVLHRVGTDRAAPLDSQRSAPDGRFRFRYRASGDPNALYFVSARHDGIAYFSPPLRGKTVRGGDADIIAYDTTSETTALRVQGRHLVIAAPRGSGDSRREIAEVFELENTALRTIVARDSASPVFTAIIPAEAESLSVAPGDVTPAAVTFRRGRAELFAPISPGLRQLVLLYLLPSDAFPLTKPVERNVGVLEVLLEEPRATVEGGTLAEVAPGNIDGRSFRRFLAQNAPASAVIRVIAPQPVGQNRAAMLVLAVMMVLAMAGAIVAWRVRGRPVANAGRPESEAERILLEIAALDARFDRKTLDREQYERLRADLKARLEPLLPR